MGDGTTESVVLDACMAITFGNARKLDVVASLHQYDVLIAARASAEVLRKPARAELDEALRRRTISLVSIDTSVTAEIDALVHFDAMSAFRGRGDAEVLALAASRDLLVGSDDISVQRWVREHLGCRRLLSSLDVLVLATRENQLTLAAANRLLERLDVGPRYGAMLKTSGKTIQDLL